MNFVQRAINLITQPKAELARAAVEPATQAGLISGYAAIVGLLPTVGRLLGVLLLAGSAFGSGIIYLIIMLAFLYVLVDVGVPVAMGMILAALAPNLGGQRNNIGGLKLAVYAATPIWAALFVANLLIFTLTPLPWLFAIIGFGYAGYLLYLGAGPMLGIPSQQAPAFAAIGAIAWLVLHILIGYIVKAIIGAILIGPGFGYLAGGFFI